MSIEKTSCSICSKKNLGNILLSLGCFNEHIYIIIPLTNDDVCIHEYFMNSILLDDLQ